MFKIILDKIEENLFIWESLLIKLPIIENFNQLKKENSKLLKIIIENNSKDDVISILSSNINYFESMINELTPNIHLSLAEKERIKDIYERTNKLLYDTIERNDGGDNIFNGLIYDLIQKLKLLKIKVESRNIKLPELYDKIYNFTLR